MKILIVTYDEYINIPYIEKYEKCIKECGSTSDVILWDRRNCSYLHPKNHFIFKAKSSRFRILKVVPFVRWRKFVLRQLKTHFYDKIIVLTTMPAILLCDLLLCRYNDRYFFDIRDFTYENIYPYKKLVHLIVKGAAVTAISSKAFMDFLNPSANIVCTHNLANDEYEEVCCTFDPEKSEPFVIGWVGGIRYYHENTQLLLTMRNNRMFQMLYIGKVYPGCDLQKFCQKHEIQNVQFMPAYENRQKPILYRSIDVINSLYGAKSPEVTLALPNRLYDCALYKKPILVSRGTYLADVVEKFGLGLAVDIDKDDIGNCLQCYFRRFNRNKFEEGCRKLLKASRSDEEMFRKRLYEFCKEK